ncbi:MAG TPA: glucose-6-phosphate dehydrogenase [Rectinemataceae bacterium]|nr:glucose-6-phosphate dehydrogenase [Rectinemataceae bacterium]
MENREDLSRSCVMDDEDQLIEPAVIVIFGATGDLALRKIFPALYNLDRMERLHPQTKVLGFARKPYSREEFVGVIEKAVSRFSHTQPLQPELWARLADRMDYFRGDLDDSAAFARLAALLAGPDLPVNKLFYLAMGPDLFGPTAKHLAEAGLGSAERGACPDGTFRRLVVEKPYGSDRASAKALSKTLQDYFSECDIFRIDHYLGKETVQNLIYLRFANSIFEPVWNRNHIESIEIDVLESGGIGSRGGYYDRAGASRDMMQNHLVQLLCLTAMEPPATLKPESIREEKVKVLNSIHTYSKEELLARSVRGQYGPGHLADGSETAGYRAEPKVAADSRTETFAALRLEVDNWRFAGVPFTLRTGKALDRQMSEIRVRFRRPPSTLFQGHCGDSLAPNLLTIRIQPDEGMWLGFNAKVPGVARIDVNELRISYRERNNDYFPEAYERLIGDALAGDPTLFIRADEAEEAWRLVDSLVAAWNEGNAPLVVYEAGSSGPALPRA